ncbi:MAG: hypothetical protein G01um101433_934 [Parcubacteria group bacterium Gr01-1014_33]|nr:MAG: hypothetical protein G01um101433_934 [Parcubacteria group bacterium Gr01-1014_33]
MPMAKTMKNLESKKDVHYDAESDVFYIGMRGEEEEYGEVAPGIGVELDENEKVIGIEILNASGVFKPLIRTLQRKVVAA